MIPIEDLLKPIAPDRPCGDDPSYDPDFRQLEVLIRGKPETVLSTVDEKAEEPNWNLIEEHCLNLFKKSKHLYVAVALTLACLKAQGLPGFRDGVAFIRGLLEQYWDPIYPRLDPEDRNDPTERLNILTALCAPPGTLGDYMSFVVRVRQAPLCQSRKAPISASDIIKAEAHAPEAKSVAEIRSEFAEAAAAEIQASHRALSETLLHIKEIDSILTRVIGISYDRSWNELTETIEDVLLRLTRYAPESHGQSGSPNVIAQGVVKEESQIGGTAAISGAVVSRQDVLRALDTICEYYRRSEPSSPVPFLLRRAQRLVDKDFMEIVNELTPESLGPLKMIVGDKSGTGSAQNGMSKDL